MLIDFVETIVFFTYVQVHQCRHFDFEFRRFAILRLNYHLICY